jgi:hypothetical protein
MNVERDYPNLAIAAREVFEEGWSFRKVERTLRQNDVRERADLIQKVVGKRTLAEGYYEWVSYLLWLSRMHEIVEFHGLLFIEVRGIEVVREQKTLFMAAHPGCYKCGAMNEKFAMRCVECKADLK